MKRYLFITAAILFLSVKANAETLSLTLENKSKWEIHELYFSPADEKEWGEDQLGEEVISNNESFTLTKIPRGNYDVKIVDEDGDACEIGDVDFRATEHFAITDDILIGCQVATAQDHEADEGEEE